MWVFQERPEDIFPFAISGCDSFKNNTTCTLVDANPLEGTGDVSVETTTTSVRFTDVSDDYFDAPGSTIEFSTFEPDAGIYLHQSADAIGTNMLVTRGVEQGIAKWVWASQASDLNRAVNE